MIVAAYSSGVVGNGVPLMKKKIPGGGPAHTDGRARLGHALIGLREREGELRCDCAAAVAMDPEMIPSDYEDEPPVAMKRCTVRDRKCNWQCFRMFPVTDKYKLCPHHRKKGREAAARPLTKAKNAERHKTPKYRKKKSEYASRPEYKASQREKGKIPEVKARRRAIQKKSRARPEGMAKKKITDTKWRHGPKGKEHSKRQKVMNNMRWRLFHMIHGEESQTIISMGCFKSNDHVRQHFESTWEPWMSWENYGPNTGRGYQLAWNIGHKLPCFVFDKFNPNDLRKCFMPMNLFAQDAKENGKLRHNLTMSDIELEALRPCWPDAAKGSLVLLKALFAGEAARAVAEGSSSSAHSAAAGSEAAAPAEDSEAETAAETEVDSAAETEAEETAEED